MVNILSSDILIADVIIPLLTPEELAHKSQDFRQKYELLNTKLDEILEEKKARRGQKAAISKEQLDALSGLAHELGMVHEENIVPGGSSANTLTTLAKLMKGKARVCFLGAVGEGKFDPTISESLSEADIERIPETFPAMPESATSLVFVAPDGSRTITTYPGNAKDMLKSEMVTDDVIDDTNVIFVQGSLWEKMGDRLPNRLLTVGWEQNKEVWLALPTHARFKPDMPEETYKWLITSADVVLGNDEELQRIYKKDFQGALEELSDALTERDKVRQREGKPERKKDAVAFITRGKEGAVVVHPNRKFEYVGIADIEPGEIKNTLGAGDTSFAGFLAGHIAGMKPKGSAAFAMELAAEKLRWNTARIPEPRDAMLRNVSRAATVLIHRMDAKLAEKEHAGRSAWSAA